MPTVGYMLTVQTMTALLVDGLALSATADDLKRMFTPFGSVLWCRVAVDHCGQPLRYGYVAMDTEDHAEKAISALNGQLTAGFTITIARTAPPPLPHP